MTRGFFNREAGEVKKKTKGKKLLRLIRLSNKFFFALMSAMGERFVIVMGKR
jgi:hypothetical protein